MTFPLFFNWVLQASASAAILVPVILLLKYLLKNRMDARWHYCIWLLLVARLLLPLSPESKLSVFNAIPVQSIVVSGNTGAAGAAGPGPELPGVVETEKTDLAGVHTPGNNAGNEASTKTGGVNSLYIIWLGGAAALALYLLFFNAMLWLKYRGTATTDDPHISAVVDECRQELGVKAGLAVITCPEIKSPALFCFLRPRLLFPEGLSRSLETGELRCIVMHELAHLKRRDIPVYWLTGLFQVLHWFNPLVWYGFYRMRQDSEMACDAYVLSRFQQPERKKYGETMIKLAAAGAGTRPVLLPGLAGIVEEETQIKRRITMISNFKKSSLALSIAGLILLAGLAAFFLTSARPDTTEPYGLGSPGKMVIYADHTAVEITTGSAGFSELLEAAEAAIQYGSFDNMAEVDFPPGGVGEYMSIEGLLNGLEIIYDEPVVLSFVDSTVHRIFIDLDRAQLLISADNGTYRSGGFFLAEMEELHGRLLNFIRREPVNADDLIVNGLCHLGMSGEEVVDIFGEPVSTGIRVKEESWHNEAYMVYWDTWVYQGFELNFISSRLKEEPEPGLPERIYAIRITGDEYGTSRGIRVGDPVEKVLDLYGYRNLYDNTLSYEGMFTEMVLFIIQDGKVVEIILTTTFS